MTDADIQVQTKTKIKRPSLYKVVFYNDDYTPVDFVIWLLMNLFDKDQIEAENLTMKIHKHGNGVAGVYIKSIAQAKAKEATDTARLNQHPLKVKAEKM